MIYPLLPSLNMHPMFSAKNQWVEQRLIFLSLLSFSAELLIEWVLMENELNVCGWLEKDVATRSNERKSSKMIGNWQCSYSFTAIFLSLLCSSKLEKRDVVSNLLLFPLSSLSFLRSFALQSRAILFFFSFFFYFFFFSLSVFNIRTIPTVALQSRKASWTSISEHSNSLSSTRMWIDGNQWDLSEQS